MQRREPAQLHGCSDSKPRRVARITGWGEGKRRRAVTSRRRGTAIGLRKSLGVAAARTRQLFEDARLERLRYHLKCETAFATDLPEPLPDRA
jgi:hypothetical protein